MSAKDTAPVNPTKRLSKGARNLILLGITSILVATATTGISLAIYHNSGDIYLDRSRPGIIPEEGEEDDAGPEEYDFGKTGKITQDTITEYLEKLDTDVKAIDSYDKPFAEDVLSDKNLGIEIESTQQ